jgi:hypothetical protein
MARNFLQRLLDAERISEELDDAWKDISLAYDELIVCALLLPVSCDTDESIRQPRSWEPKPKWLGYMPASRMFRAASPVCKIWSPMFR